MAKEEFEKALGEFKTFSAELTRLFGESLRAGATAVADSLEELARNIEKKDETNE